MIIGYSDLILGTMITKIDISFPCTNVFWVLKEVEENETPGHQVYAIDAISDTFFGKSEAQKSIQ